MQEKLLLFISGAMSLVSKVIKRFEYFLAEDKMVVVCKRKYINSCAANWLMQTFNQ